MIRSVTLAAVDPVTEPDHRGKERPDVDPEEPAVKHGRAQKDQSQDHQSEQIVSAGYALPVVFQPNIRYLDRIEDAALGARAGAHGLWGSGFFGCSPADFRSGLCR